MLDGERLRGLAGRLVEVPGVVGVMLGGSRARGDHTPASDVDLGLYYRSPLDVAALGGLAREVAGPRSEVTRPGDWGPWVDGGGSPQDAGEPAGLLGQVADHAGPFGQHHLRGAGHIGPASARPATAAGR